MAETKLSTMESQDGQAQDTKGRPESTQPIVQRNTQPESTYLEGTKLYLMLLGVGATVFLMMLDQTIVVTVCRLALHVNYVDGYTSPVK
jgi:hypothetical protein